MVEVLKLDRPALRIFRIKMIDIKTLIHLRLISGNGAEALIHGIHLFPGRIKKGDNSLYVSLIGAAKAKKHIPMAENLTGSLIQPERTSYLRGIKPGEGVQLCGSEK